ncbi:putative small, acid-soluble spore protein tlp [uncultured Eubacteriales bacterium]|uniref:Putative small, acid-soluble spore protein tlp n=1 Tax=uncultured Eubacteriales bacterium TaxID=172733 RepID=A0A212KC74_9FIRM|nr:putative small, acid-soluble spore protein tlp [uncultured Eubacteriales bacterium]
MNRDILIQQVKIEYARLAELASRGHITNQSYGGMLPEAYFEQTLEKAIRDISAGRYDDCSSGLQVVEQIANHKTKARRIQDTIESTLHNMEIAEELISTESDSKKKLQLDTENERRAEALPHMMRSLKEEQAQEALDADGPSVIGGRGNG